MCIYYCNTIRVNNFGVQHIMIYSSTKCLNPNSIEDACEGTLIWINRFLGVIFSLIEFLLKLIAADVLTIWDADRSRLRKSCFSKMSRNKPSVIPSDQHPRSSTCQRLLTGSITDQPKLLAVASLRKWVQSDLFLGDHYQNPSFEQSYWNTWAPFPSHELFESPYRLLGVSYNAWFTHSPSLSLSSLFLCLLNQIDLLTYLT